MNQSLYPAVHDNGPSYFLPLALSSDKILSTRRNYVLYFSSSTSVIMWISRWNSFRRKIGTLEPYSVLRPGRKLPECTMQCSLWQLLVCKQQRARIHWNTKQDDAKLCHTKWAINLFLVIVGLMEKYCYTTFRTSVSCVLICAQKQI